uniref:Bulb-type lectin domain-containing protein n=1 Tax=Nelumbo nucifera TaxID=4432 RepID=A0A822YZ71_NELNU|nr:TPA_asm: hypothetical protein HUJ06_007166 [Nelumbo nucifera]
MAKRNIGRGRYCFLFAILCCLSCVGSLHAASDTTTNGQQIKDGHTLVSAGGHFELGFFSPNLNSKNRYVGIWYKRITVKTVVWVANRDRPLVDSSGILMINNEGNLVVMDWRGGCIMITYGSATSSNTSVKLSDDGNLIFVEENSDKQVVLWQSFDYPTDTFLPGMKLGRNLKSKQNRLLTSWRSADDPSSGVYTFGADPNGTTQFFIWQEGVVYWSSGDFKDNTFSLTPKSGYRKKKKVAMGNCGNSSSGSVSCGCLSVSSL